jgi:hypothetical protein
MLTPNMRALAIPALPAKPTFVNMGGNLGVFSDLSKSISDSQSEPCEKSPCLPKWTDKPPNLSDKGDEDSNTGSFLTIAINSVGDQNSCNDLVAGSSDTGTNNWRHIPVKCWRIPDLDQKYDDADDGEQIANIAQPKSKFGRWTGINLARTSVHPDI